MAKSVIIRRPTTDDLHLPPELVSELGWRSLSEKVDPNYIVGGNPITPNSVVSTRPHPLPIIDRK